MPEPYVCILNGRFYGGGNLQYMQELFVDYVVHHQMYGKDEVDFKIIKRSEYVKRTAKKTIEKYHEALKKLDD